MGIEPRSGSAPILCVGQQDADHVLVELLHFEFQPSPLTDVECAFTVGVVTAVTLGPDHVISELPDFCVDEVSSQAIAFLMALNRRLFPIDRAVREKQIHLITPNREVVAKYAHPIQRLRDQTLGIIGFGRIGTAVALKAKGLGMRVIAYDPYVFGAIMKVHGVEPVDFDKLAICLISCSTKGNGASCWNRLFPANRFLLLLSLPELSTLGIKLIEGVTEKANF